MGKETKIGLGVIAALLVVFAVVLTLRFTGSSGDSVAAADAEQTESDAKDKVAPAPSPSATTVKAAKPQLPPSLPSNGTAATPKTQASQFLTIPMPPKPDDNANPQNATGWSVVGNGTAAGKDQSRVKLGTPGNNQRQQRPIGPAPLPARSPLLPGPSNITLDPPSPQQISGLTSNRSPRQRPMVDRQRPNYQLHQNQSDFHSVSDSRDGLTHYKNGNYHQAYSNQQEQRSYRPQQTYAGQHTITPPPVSQRQSLAGPRADGTYEVQPNDSYWLISKRLYGSGAYFKALAEHNRREHPVADQLRVGDCISAPALAKLVDSFPDLCPSPKRQKVLAKRASVVSVSRRYGSHYGGSNTYTVEEGDTLYDIARYELGDASRWVEIHELNRQVLQGDFDYLVPGMKLAMPSGSTDSLTRRPEAYQQPSQNVLRR